MKIAAMVTVVAVLLNAVTPTLAHAATYLQGTEVNANTLVQDAYVAVTYYDSNGQEKTEKGWIDVIGETTFTIRSGGLKSKKAIAYDNIVSIIMSNESTVPAKQMNEVNRFIREMRKREIEQSKKEKEAKEDQAITVMPHGQIDTSKIIEGWYAHAIYTSEGAEETATGKITRQDSIHIVIRKLESGVLKTLKTIAYSDVDTLVIAQHAWSIEKWENARQVTRHYEQALRTLKQTAVTVMSRGQFGPSKIMKGWYAHVVYTSKGEGKRTTAGQIVNKDATHIFVKDRMDRITTWTIAYDEINTLVVAKQWQDIERYRETGARYNTKVRFKASSISKRQMIGRLVEIIEDTLIIEGSLQGSTHRRRPRPVEVIQHVLLYVPLSSISNLEVSIGQQRNTSKGMAIGAGVGLCISIPSFIYGARNPDNLGALGAGIVAFYATPCFFILGGLIGAASKSDRWVKVSLQSLNLSLAPTSTKGLRAAITFNF